MKVDKSAQSFAPALVFARMRILIVEDELLVRMFAVDALEDEGFQVEQAGTAAEALRSVQQLGSELHALIIDLGLPDRNGDQLAAELRQAQVDVPILIASGRSEREIRDRFAHDPRIGILGKPYTAAMLIDALEKVGIKSGAQ
jgi:DNA-binding response OmpR family regulator